MYTYHNYSRSHYGNISVREALGNSLNIPAIRTIQFVGPEKFLSFLRELGVESLSQHPNVYGDGLALGNGELTLFELVEAYTVLARMGDHKPLTALQGEHRQRNNRRIFSADIASLVADILSDPAAREKEFGWNSILNFPHQTAVKTGTSSDYRDAWASVLMTNTPLVYGWGI
jgi:penicillin-binding protein 1C